MIARSGAATRHRALAATVHGNYSLNRNIPNGTTNRSSIRRQMVAVRQAAGLPLFPCQRTDFSCVDPHRSGTHCRSHWHRSIRTAFRFIRVSCNACGSDPLRRRHRGRISLQAMGDKRGCDAPGKRHTSYCDASSADDFCRVTCCRTDRRSSSTVANAGKSMHYPRPRSPA